MHGVLKPMVNWEAAKVKEVEKHLWRRKTLEAIHIRSPQTSNLDNGVSLGAMWVNIRGYSSTLYIGMVPAVSFSLYICIGTKIRNRLKTAGKKLCIVNKYLEFKNSWGCRPPNYLATSLGFNIYIVNPND